jgi:acyl-CoA hydrolase
MPCANWEAPKVVTKLISEINFVSSGKLGDIVEMGMTASEFGRTSITLKCEVRNKITKKAILTIDRMVFVNVNDNGEPIPHGKTRMRKIDEKLENLG